MTRYLLTAQSFTGSAVLIYNEDGILCTLDLTQTNLTGPQAAWFFRNMPPYLTGLPEKGEPSLNEFLKTRKGVNVVQEDVEVTFEMFWIKYDKKINRKRCVDLWEKLPKNKKVRAYYGIWVYTRFLQSTGWRSKADPENYISREMWENEWK